MKPFGIMTWFLLAVPLLASAGPYTPTSDKKYLIITRQTVLTDSFAKNLEKIRNPSSTNMISQARDIKLVESENLAAVNDVREVFSNNLEMIRNPSTPTMISQTTDIKDIVSKNSVAVSNGIDVFTNNLEMIRNPSIANEISQTVDMKYVVSEIQ